MNRVERLQSHRFCFVIWLLTLCTAFSPVGLRADEGDDLYNLSLGLLRQKRYESAIETLEKLVKTYPTHPKTELGRLRLGLTYLATKDYASARKHLRDFVQKNPESQNLAEAMYQIGYSSFQLQDMKAAEQELAAFHARFPDHKYREWSLAHLGYAQLNNDQPDKALGSFKTSLEAFPTGAMREDSLFGKARALEESDKTAEALPIYRELAANKTGLRSDKAMMSIGAILFQQQKFKEAAEQYETLTSVFPESGYVMSARMNAGYAYYQAHLFADAEKQFAILAALDYQQPTVLYWQGMSQKSAGNYDAALTTFAKAEALIEDESKAALLRFQWGDAAFNAGKFEIAKTQFLASQQAGPKEDSADDALYLAAESALMLSELDEASALLERFRKEYPTSNLKSYQALLTARVAVRRGSAADLKQAETIFRQLLDDLNQSLANQSRFYLGRTLEKQNRYHDAIDALEPLTVNLTKTSSAELWNAFLIKAECHRRLAMQFHLEARPLRQQLSAIDDVPGAPSAKELAAQIEKLFEASSEESRKAIADLDSYLKFYPAGAKGIEYLQIRTVSAALSDNESVAEPALRDLQQVASPAIVGQITFEMAEIVYDRGLYDWSAQLFESLTKIEPAETWKPVAGSGLGWSLYENKKYAEAAQAFATVTAANELHELAPESSFMQAEALLKAEQTQAAQEQFAATFARYAPPEPMELKDLRGRASFAWRAGLQSARTLNQLQKIDEADKAYETVLNRFPNQANFDRFLNEWAVMNANAERFEKSDQIFKRLLSYDPGSRYADGARLSLAESALQEGQLADAREQLQLVVRNESADESLRKRALEHLIRTDISAGNWDEVNRWGDEFRRMFPNDPFRYSADFYQAEALLNQDKVTDAEKLLLKVYAERQNPEVQKVNWFPRLWVLLAEAAVRQKQYQRVMQLSEEMETLETAKPYLYQIREIEGRALKNQAKLKEAIAVFESVTQDEFGEKTQTAAKCQFLIGETLLINKDYKSALEAYLKVYLLYKFPQWQAPALYQAGQCDEALQQWEKALTSYEDLLRDFPSSEYAKLARKRIDDVKRKL